MKFHYVILTCLALHVANVQPHKVGILLNSKNMEKANAISRVADYFLSQLTSSQAKIQIEKKIHSSSYYSLVSEVCALFEEDVVSIISVSDSTLTKVQVNIASQLNVPIIAGLATNSFLESSNKFGGSAELVRLSPSDIYQSQAIFDLLKAYQWREFSILASADDYGTDGVVHLLYLAAHDERFRIKNVQHFDTGLDVSNSSAKLFTNELQLIKDSLVMVIVLNCAQKFTDKVFQEAKEFGLMEESFVWIVTDAVATELEDISSQDSHPASYRGIIGTIPSSGKGSDRYKQIEKDYIAAGKNPNDLSVSSVMVFEGLRLVESSLRALDRGSWDDSPSVNCKTANDWPGGIKLFDKMIENLSQENQDHITYDIMNFQSEGFVKIGMWRNTTGLVDQNNEKARWLERKDVVYIGEVKSVPSGFGKSLTGHHLRVGVVEENPISLYNENCTYEKSSPKCWYGWNPDIIKRLANDLNFTYEYVEQSEGKYGSFDEKTKSWNGMVGDIVNTRIDLTVALSINSIRSQYIGYSTPFYEDQAAMAVRLNTATTSTNMFFFLEPFELSVWLTILALIVMLGILMTCISALSPFRSLEKKTHEAQTGSGYGHKRESDLKGIATKTHCEPVGDAAEEEEDNMSYNNSQWLIGAGFVWHASAVLPRAPSGRFLLFIWWFFVMILTSMYTANLTAHLTLDQASVKIENLEELLTQRDYSWVLVGDRNLETMMLNHENDDYQNIAKKADKVLGVDDGIARVKAGGTVFIDENSVLAVYLRGECKTKIIKTGKFTNHWAFGLQSNSPYAAYLNNMLLRYREEGWLTEKHQEWYSGDSRNSCSTSLGSHNTFNLQILSGLFLILGIGVLLSCVAIFLELLYVAHVISVKTDSSFSSCLKRTIRSKFAEIRCTLSEPKIFDSSVIHKNGTNVSDYLST